MSARRGWGTQRANPVALQRKDCASLCPGPKCIAALHVPFGASYFWDG